MTFRKNLGKNVINETNRFVYMPFSLSSPTSPSSLSLSLSVLLFSLLLLTNTYRFDSFELRIVGCHLLLIYVTYLLPALLCFVRNSWKILILCTALFARSQLPVLLISFAALNFLFCHPTLNYLFKKASIVLCNMK